MKEYVMQLNSFFPNYKRNSRLKQRLNSGLNTKNSHYMFVNKPYFVMRGKSMVRTD